MAVQDLLDNMGYFVEGFQGLKLMSDGADQALAGAEFNAKLYDMAATSSIEMAEYNVALQQINSQRIQNALAQEYRSIREKNVSAWSTSGFSFASDSFNAVQNKVQSSVERRLIEQKNNDIIQKQNIRYEGKAAAVNYENQAKAARYQGELASYNASQQQMKSLGGMFQNAMSFLMS